MAKAEANTLINLASSLYVIPYFLFSLAAGQLADKYEKSRVIRIIKAAEILIAVLGTIALLTNDRVLSFIVLMLFATHTALFSPVRYAILPQHLKKPELLGGNGLAQVASFAGLLVGTIVGTLLAGYIGQGKPGLLYLSLVMVTVAILGYFSSKAIPLAPSSAPNLKIYWNPITQTLRIMREVVKIPTVFYAIIANSWFWLLSTAYLTQVPSFVRNVLGASEPVITLLLCCLTIGVAIGSLMCESLSRGRVELGLVAVGGLGMTVAGAWLGILSGGYQMLSNASLIEYLKSDGGYTILFITTFFGTAGGIFIVPLYTIIQDRTSEKIRAQVISVNNVLNALFVVIISITIIGLLDLARMTIPQLFSLLAVLNFFMLVLLVFRMPEMLFDTLAWLTYFLPRRTRYEGLERLPPDGPALLLASYSNLLTPFIISGATPRKVRFIPSDSITNSPSLHALLRKSDSVPKNYYGPQTPEPKRKHVAIREAEKNQQLLCILVEENSKEELEGLVILLKEILQESSLPLIPLSIKGSLSRDPTSYRRNLKTLVQVSSPIPVSDITLKRLSDNLKGASLL
ncbi:MFS transporter [Microbulbifer sp. OS29]|uniref:MFS transporter n=1 Tax=Microbulbifer okhotskensis TaxID=2926617 RepID=A0A9X2EPK4_9GAMM|nr:MFS transporter [Microbulbifer okhotskensis]